MGIRKVKFIKNNYYHIYNRGCNKENIFIGDENYIYLLRKIIKYKDEFNISVIAYCLMPNHYHFLLRQDSEVLISDFMQRVFNSYTKAINKKYGRSGTLFEGKYQAIHIDKENYLIHLCRYIHRNPIEAKLVSNISEWKYSNYLDWLGMRKGKLVDKNFILDRFGSANNYKKFIEDEYKEPINFKSLCLD